MNRPHVLAGHRISYFKYPPVQRSAWRACPVVQSSKKAVLLDPRCFIALHFGSIGHVRDPSLYFRDNRHVRRARPQLEGILFELNAQKRDKEIAKINKLNQGLITALRNRYQEQ